MQLVKFMEVSLPGEEDIESAEISNHVEYVQLSEMDPNLMAISEALEDINTLLKIKRSLNSPQNVVSTESMSMTVIAIESIAKNYPFKPMAYDAIVSMESIGSKTTLEYTTEGIGDLIQRIWDAIVRTIKFIWDKITGWLGFGSANSKSLKVQVEKAEAEVKAMDKQLQLENKVDGMTSVINNIASGKELGEITNQRLLDAFAYLNTELDSAKLLRQLDFVEDTCDKLISLVRATENAHYRLRHNLTELEMDDVKTLITNHGITKEIAADFVFEDLHKEVKQHTTPSKDNRLDAGIIREFFTFENMEMDEDSISTIDNFTHGGRVFFFRSKDPDDGNYYLLAAEKISEPDDQSCTLEFMNNDTLGQFVRRLSVIEKKSERMTAQYNTSYSQIKFHHSIIVKQMTRAVQALKKHDNPDEATKSFDYVKQMTRAILRLASETAKANAMFTGTMQMYLVLVSASTDEHRRLLAEAKKTAG